jgi:hypothetical protein
MKHFIFLIPVLLVLGSSCSRKMKPGSEKSKVHHQPSLASDVQPWPTRWWSAKMKISLQNEGTQIPLTLILRAEEGKSIWFSATALGLLEVARGKLDNDSVLIHEKMGNQCIRTAMSGLGPYLPLNLGMKHLQHFLMGRVFWDSLEKAVKNQQSDTVRFSGLQGSVSCLATILNRYQLLDARLELGADARVNLINKDFRPVSDFPVAFSKEIKSESHMDGKKSEVLIRIEFSRFEFLQDPPDLEFSLPADCIPMQMK